MYYGNPTYNLLQYSEITNDEEINITEDDKKYMDESKSNLGNRSLYAINNTNECHEDSRKDCWSRSNQD
jgi:hypothetical protein